MSDAELFQKYIGDKTVLVVDTAESSRLSISRHLANLGCKPERIFTADGYVTAAKEISARKPQIVISDFSLGQKSGLELVELQRKQFSRQRDRLFILVTSNTSQSAVARAVEEDVDAFLLKPFMAGVLRSSILKAVSSKFNVSEYRQAIDQGLEAFHAGNFEEAERCFTHARSLDSAPVLAISSLGLVQQKKGNLEAAEQLFQEVLKTNKIHQRSLVGLFEVQNARNQPVQAYETIKRICGVYPITGERLSAALRLAIQTKSFEDVERFYQAFKKLNAPSPETARYVCAALVVCGKHYLGRNTISRATDLFQRAVALSDKGPKVLREIILAYAENNQHRLADEFLKEFPTAALTGPEYQAMAYVLTERELPADVSMERGKSLLAKGIHDPAVYELLIRRAVEKDLKPTIAELVANATTRWPALRERWAQLASGAPKPQ